MKKTKNSILALTVLGFGWNHVLPDAQAATIDLAAAAGGFLAAGKAHHLTPAYAALAARSPWFANMVCEMPAAWKSSLCNCGMRVGAMKTGVRRFHSRPKPSTSPPVASSDWINTASAPAST